MKLFGKTERLPLPKLNSSPKITVIKNTYLSKAFLVKSNYIIKHRHPPRVLEKCGKKAYVYCKYRAYVYCKYRLIQFYR